MCTGAEPVCHTFPASGSQPCPAEPVQSRPTRVGNARAVAVGDGHVCVLRLTGIVCGGINTFGRLGSVGQACSSVLHVDEPILGLAAGSDHTCTVSMDGAVRCWGSNEFGALGAAWPYSMADPTPVVPGHPLGSVRAIATGTRSTCVLGEDGTPLCWGIRGSTPTGTVLTWWESSAVSSLAPARNIRASSAICAMQSGGAIRCATPFRDTSVEVSITVSSDVWDVGRDSVCGETVDGLDCATILGLVEGETREAPETASPRIRGPLRGIAAGDDFWCVIDAQGTTTCWGGNARGQLGSGDTTERGPVILEGVPPAVSVAAGGDTACIVSNELEVWCWGDNRHGQISETMRALGDHHE